MSKQKLVIFDTTLRDGEQSPGASMTKEEKLRIAKLLEMMRVDVIEAGFAIASEGDFEAVKLVADNIKDSRVCSLARAAEMDIRRAGEAVAGANAARIHTFIATSLCRLLQGVPAIQTQEPVIMTTLEPRQSMAATSGTTPN